MKISDRNPPGEHESAIVRGHIGPLAAAGSGLTTVTGGGTTVNGITGLSFSGLEVIDGGSTAVVMTKWKIPCRVATTVAGTLASSFEAGDTVDGVTLAAGDRVLIKDQASADENGIYIVASSGAPNRSSDADEGYELLGAVVYVYAGTANTAGLFACTNTTEPTIGTDDVTFARVNSTGGSGGTGVSGWFNVKDYGAVGDGTADDTAEVNAAIAALIAAGKGVLYFPAGTYKCTTSLSTISVSCLILGDGGTDGSTNTISMVTFTSATTSLFTVTAHGVTFRGLTLYNTAVGTPSAGAGITTTGGILARFEDLSVFSFYTGIDIENGVGWTMDNLYVANVKKYGVRIRNTATPDAGDWTISNSLISNNNAADAAIRIESSGGGKCFNVKVNGAGGSNVFTYGIDLAVAGSVDTSILLLSNCSIENVSTHGIRGTTSAGTSKWGNIAIINCQFLILGNTGKGISLVGNAAGDFYNIIIADCEFGTPGSARSAMQLTNCDNVNIGTLTLSNFTPAFTSTTNTNFHDYTGGVAGVDISGAPSAGMVPIASSSIAAAWGSLSTGGIAPNTVDYLVGTASAGLTAEIVVGTTPGGELGGTWASPTVDATHSGSAHTDFIAKSLVDAKGDLIAATADNTVARVAVGTDGKYLKADSGASAGVSWDTPSGSGAVATDTIWDAKGDLVAATGADAAVRVPVGTDGKYLKADSGATAGVSWDTPSGTGAVATDAIWDAAGDLAVGSGADTAVRLAKGSAGAVLAMLNGALAWNAGTSFPGSPATNDRYYRTDVLGGTEYFYDGTRWLTTHIFEVFGSVNAISATTDVYVPMLGVSSGLWLIDVRWSYQVNTTHSATQFWAVTFFDTSGVGGATLTSDKSTVGGFVTPTPTAVGALFPGGASRGAIFRFTKTSTPGTLLAGAAARYRIVG